jgi:hypothetical protein
VLLVEADGSGVGGAGLHRDMQLHVGMAAAGIIEHGEVGDDQGIGPECGTLCPRPASSGHRSPVGKGVDGDVQLAAMLVDIVNRFSSLLSVKLSPAKWRALVSSLKPM